jgi:hypothetical protein
LKGRHMNPVTILSKSDKTIAVVAGTLIVRATPNPSTTDEAAARSFERAIDTTGLRRSGSAQVQRNETVIELRCRVEYGPVFGAYKSDLRRSLEGHIVWRINGEGEGDVGEVLDTAVFDVSRRAFRTPHEIEAVITDLMVTINDISLPLDRRMHLEKTIGRLQQHIAEVQG